MLVYVIMITCPLVGTLITDSSLLSAISLLIRLSATRFSTGIVGVVGLFSRMS